MVLTGLQIEQLSEALRNAFRTRKALEQMLKFKLDRDLDVPSDLSMRDTMFDLIRTAEDEGWTAELLKGALAASNNPKLHAFARVAKISHEAPPQLSFELVNPGHFDLSDLDEVYWDTLAPSPDVAAKRRVIGFVVRYFDEPFLTHLCDRILKHSGLGQTHRISWLTLDPALNSVAYTLASLGKHKALFGKKHLFCPVRAESAENALIEEFWNGVCGEFTGELPNNLLILFTGKTGHPFPPGVVEMPKPQFKFGHLQDWTQKLVHHLQWPPPLADRWSNRLFDRSKLGTPPALDIRWVYESLVEDIDLLRMNPTQLRDQLENTG